MKVLVVIPAYNEEKNILNVCKKLDKTKKELNFILDYIVINDGSSDSTEFVCKKNKIPMINLSQNLGIGGAVQTGYKYAFKKDYDIVIQFDGDGQHNPDFIKELVEPIKNNVADMTIGSRYIGDLSEFKSSKLRQLGISLLSWILKLTTKQKIFDVTSGFRAVNKSLIRLFSDDYPNDYPEPETIVAVLKKGYKVKEIPVKMHERVYGKSSITPLKSIYYMMKVSYAMVIRSIIERGENNGK